MCGICGFNWDDKRLVKGMMDSLIHRGPDGGGFYTDENVSLGHRRLSIIDLSDAGKQPMGNRKGNLLITYNGEVYNFPAIKARLEDLGHRFSSGTDTEVIIEGYEEWGSEVVTKLNGMFAFCIYDRDKKELFLARDRTGVKPLYYYWNGERFIFASEIKAILLAGVQRKVNLPAVRQYLQLRYVPGEETLFEGIRKVPPGFTLTLKNGELSLRQYWDVPIPKIARLSLREAALSVREILQDSVSRRLVADVPVGVYLSGGLDSAAITALAAGQKQERAQEPLKTFSVGFAGHDQADESGKARKIAEYFSTDHQEVLIDEPITPLLPKLVWHLDMPHGDPVIIPQYKLAQLAAQKVKVVLSGEGADEIFAGYVQYKTFLQAQKGRYFPLAGKLIGKLPVKQLDRFFDYPESMGEKGKEKVADFLQDVQPTAGSYQHLTSILSDKDKTFLFQEQLKNTPVPPPAFDPARKPLLNKLLYYDIKNWLPNYILQINDRMTMAHSIEGRTPFLDYRLVEYSTQLPADWKLQGSTTKFILREAMKGILPDTAMKKHAFFTPLDHWYKEELRGLAEQLFTPASVKERGYFNYYYLKKIWENYERSKLLYGKQLFTMINLELWHRTFLDARRSLLKPPKMEQLV